MEAIEIFKNPLSKSQQQDVINNSIDLILSGEIDPLKAEITLSSMEKVIEAIRKNPKVKDLILYEAAKNPKIFEIMRAEITQSSRTTYKYEDCGDDVLNDLMAQKSKIDEQIKIRQSIIKSGVDASTGETFNAPKSSTTCYLKITFK